MLSQAYLNKIIVDDTPKEAFQKYSNLYLIEELAMMAILNHRKLNTLIYPGIIQTVYDVITIDHPALINLFKDYVFVSLKLSRS